MTRKRKTVTMIVAVSCPKWLTAAQARKEVKTLINDQTHWGHSRRDFTWPDDEIGSHNFRARSVMEVAK